MLGERVPGLRIGELEGVIFRDAGPASLLFALSGAVVAITAEMGDSRSPERVAGVHGNRRPHSPEIPVRSRNVTVTDLCGGKQKERWVVSLVAGESVWWGKLRWRGNPEN